MLDQTDIGQGFHRPETGGGVQESELGPMKNMLWDQGFKPWIYKTSCAEEHLKYMEHSHDVYVEHVH